MITTDTAPALTADGKNSDVARAGLACRDDSLQSPKHEGARGQSSTLASLGRLTRRGFISGLAGAGLVVGHGSGRRALGADDELLVFSWSGYEVPEMHQPYIDKHGRAPDFAFMAGSTEAFTKVQAGFNPDLVHTCASDAYRWWDAGRVRPIDVSRLDHWDSVFPRLQEMPGVVAPDGESVILVPVDWGNISFCYRTDLVDISPEEESWQLMLDPRFAGRMSASNGVDNFRGVALAIGVEDPINMTEEDLDNVKEALVGQRDLLNFYWESSTQLTQSLATGDVVIADCWNEHSATLVSEGIPVRMANPKEGMLTWVCGLMLVGEDSEKDDLAYDYMNAILAPDSGAFLVDSYGYGHSNRSTLDRVSSERLDELGISTPDEMFARTFLSVPGQNFVEMERIVAEVQAGL